MKKKIEIKDIDGNILFTYECEDNSMKKTVEEAVKQKISLFSADLSGAYLSEADLSGAHLCKACLFNAVLIRSKLFNTQLDYANLHYADLREADFNNANLYGANLYNSYLDGAKNIPFIPLACPSEGSFIGWKKIKDYLIKLFIPEDAKRSSATSNKCRCDKAKVLEIINLKTNEHIDKVINGEYSRCVYRVGEMVYPDEFDDNRWNECSNGIHFFVNKQEAIEFIK